ncbi:restriction endonuclease subunit S [Salmonella bongori]|nr:restriction endonuclease subunit S [Salmonella bongori]EIT4622276.1 restriction endonuclease subunit S [Salmonella bongori]
MINLPKGWVSVSIEDVAEVNPKKSVNLSLDDIVTFVPMAAVDEVSGTIKEPLERPLRDVNRGFTQFVENDVLFAKITPSMENGKSAVAKNLANNIGFGSTEFHVFRSNGAVLPELLWHFIRQKKFRNDARKVMSGAVGQQRVPAEYLKKHIFNLPPLSEQTRIVAKIENLLLHTKNAYDELLNVPKLLAEYKSAVLEKAFSGALTSDLRTSNTVKETSLPKGWTIKLLGDISEIQSGIQVGKRRTNNDDLIEVPYLRVANVQRGWLKLDEIKNIAVSQEEKNRLLLKQGDILMNEGGDRDKLGRGWVWNEQISECIHQNHVFRIRMNENTLPPEFVSHYANEKGQQYFFEQGTQTTNLASISKRKVAALPIVVPPTEEAIEIVRRLNIIFSWLDRINNNYLDAFNQLEYLNSAILSKAFSGELVSQCTTDESATSLLNKIKENSLHPVTNNNIQKKKTQNKARKESMKMGKKLEHVLKEADGWIGAQTAFQLCGVGDGSSTDEIEIIYAELRELDLKGMLDTESVVDEQGRKIFDRIRLREV